MNTVPDWAVTAADAQGLPGSTITTDDANAADADALSQGGRVHNPANAPAQGETEGTTEGDQGTQGSPEGDQQGEQTPPPLPEGGVEKFYNKETGEYDWASHGKEEAYNRIRQSKQPKDTQQSRAQADDNAQNQEADQNEADVAAKLEPGVWDTISDEFAETGEISEDSREALRNVGVTDEVIDEHLEFKTWQVEQAQDAVFAAVDKSFDREDFELLQTWVRDTKEPGEIARIDKLLADVDTAPMIIKELIAEGGDKIAQSRPLQQRRGKLVEADNAAGNPGGAVGVKPFDSFASMSQAMSDPRYESNLEFRAEVDRRAAVTKVDVGSGGSFR
ncbi:MAG: hypothetical protein GY906_23305 [bacterium]|nr:hypothetical protein [bacterium]